MGPLRPDPLPAVLLEQQVHGRRQGDGRLRMCRVLRGAIPPTPPGPEGSNGNGLVRAQQVPRYLRP